MTDSERSIHSTENDPLKVQDESISDDIFGSNSTFSSRSPGLVASTATFVNNLSDKEGEDSIQNGCRQKVDPLLEPPFGTPFWTPFWTLFENDENNDKSFYYLREHLFDDVITKRILSIRLKTHYFSDTDQSCATI